MLSLVTAAEQQYRHESVARDRELALLAAIRERRAFESIAATDRQLAAHSYARPVHAAPPRRRAVWARPIGLTADGLEVCAPNCATA